MKQTYRVIAGLVALGVLVQAAAIAFGWFDAIHELDSGRAEREGSSEEAVRNAHLATIPAGRYGEPAELAVGRHVGMSGPSAKR